MVDTFPFHNDADRLRAVELAKSCVARSAKIKIWWNPIRRLPMIAP